MQAGGAGALDPPGPPAPTTVTLQQLDDSVRPASGTCFDNSGTNCFVDRGTTRAETLNLYVWPVRAGR